MRLLWRRLAILAFAVLSMAAMTARAYDQPRIAHYISEYARIGFVLDRSGEFAKLRFDGTEEILVLSWHPAAGGDRILQRDDAFFQLRISGLGGVTLFTPDYPRGIPVAPDAPAQPLVSVSPPIAVIRDIAGRIMAQLRVETGIEIPFEANWGAVAGDAGARAILNDAIRNAGTALVDFARTAEGRAGIIARLRRVRFVQARFPSISLQGDMLLIYFSVELGLAGRPSSHAIRRQLAQILH